VEFLYHEKSPEVALKELEQNLGENKFSGFGLLEARFKALELAVWAQDNQRVQKYMPSCVQGLKKVNDSQKMLFYGVMGKYYLDGNELKLAKKSLRQALTCFHSVRNPLFHAQVLDQQARLLARQDKREMAFKNWNRADEEFQKYLLSLETEGREYFKEKSCEWQEHRVIYEILQNEPSDALGRTNSGGG
jgi:predicted negative regulator of RcsB-dependent stress response